MVGILILSHSNLIAKGLLEVCKQMAKGVDIQAVGGVDEGKRLGLDVDKALSTLELMLKRDSEVVIYADIGSTVMGAQNVISLCSRPKDVHLADAPLVEGAIVGSVESMIGSSVEKILAESKKSCLMGKK
jgi:PTS hybrid protein